MKKYSETAMKYVFMASATVSIIAVVVICLFLFSKGFPTIAEIGVFEFLGGTTWKPLEGHFGIFPMNSREHLCDGGSDNIRCTYRDTVRCIYGKVLPEKII